MNSILRRAARTALDLTILLALGAGLALQAQEPYGFALFQTSGRLTDLGAVVLVLAPVVGVILALFPLARYVDERGLWQGDVR